MRNGKCSKCNSATVYQQTGGISFYGSQSFHVRTGALQTGVPYVSFLCTTCGYFENYVADAAKLAEVAQKWQKVSSGS